MENKIIGQEKLIKFADSLTIDTCPRTILLEGLKGSGRHLISKYIADALHLKLVDMTKNLTLDSITSAILSVEPMVYLIDTCGVSIKNQNTILKFLEEPTDNCVIILLTENRSLLLDTVVNRCYALKLETYSKNELRLFTGNEDVLDYSETPGDIISLQNAQFEEYKRLSGLILNSIHKASLSNTLSLSEKFKEDNMDIKLFLKIYLKTMMDFIKMNNANEKYLRLYSLTNEFFNKVKNSSNQYRLFDKYLIELHELMTG